MNIGFNPNKQAFGCSECKQGKYISRVMHEARGKHIPKVAAYLDRFAPSPSIKKGAESADKANTALIQKEHDDKMLKLGQLTITNISAADEMIKADATTIR